MTENRKYIKGIAADLKAYYNGEMLNVNGCIMNKVDVGEPILSDDGCRYYEINGERVEENEVETASLCDYLEDVLDIEYILDSSFNLIGVKLYLTLGGPTVWIDTRTQTVNIHWGADSDFVYINAGICDVINSVYDDLISDRIV